MWATTVQTDSWINIGGKNNVLDNWIRLSRIVQIRSVDHAKYAVVILSDNSQNASGYTVKELMDVISGADKDLK